MNTKTLSIAFMLVALGSAWLPSLAAAPKGPPPVAYATRRIDVQPDGKCPVVAGDSRERVRELMGIPDRELSKDAWLYWGYHSDDVRIPEEQQCRGMIVFFDGGIVTQMLLVNSRAAAAIARNIRTSEEFLVAETR